MPSMTLTCRICEKPMQKSRTSKPQGEAAHNTCRTGHPAPRQAKFCVDCTATFTGKESRCNPCRYERAKANATQTCQCGRAAIAKGMCSTHYSLKYRANHTKTFTCTSCGKDFTHNRKKATCSDACFAIAVVESEGHKARIAKAKAEATYPTSASRYTPKTEAEKRKVWRAQRSDIRAAYEDGDWAGLMRAIKSDTHENANGCWEWQRRVDDGYPIIRIAGVTHQVHRLSLHAKHGKPLGVLAAHHKCANSTCVNPNHLQPVTHRENVAEMLARNSLERRIEELESALSEIAPDHPALDRISHTAA